MVHDVHIQEIKLEGLIFEFVTFLGVGNEIELDMK